MHVLYIKRKVFHTGNENIAEATPKRAPSVPSDLSKIGQTPGLSKEMPKPGSLTKLPQRGSKETTPISDKPSELPKVIINMGECYLALTRVYFTKSMISHMKVQQLLCMLFYVSFACPESRTKYHY